MHIPNLTLSAGILVGAILGIGLANADEFPPPTDTPALPPANVAAYNWTGCYLGGYVGGATQSREVNAREPSSIGGAIPAGTYYDPIGVIPLRTRSTLASSTTTCALA